MARRLSRIVSAVLSSALILLSAGFDAQRAAAQTLTGRAATVSPTPAIGLGNSATPALSAMTPGLSLSAPALPAPAALSGAPSLIVPAAAAPALSKPSLAAASVSDAVKAIAPALQVLAKPQSGVSAAASSGRDIETALTGEKLAKTSGEASVAGSESAVAPALSPVSAASADAAPKGDVPAAKPAAPKSVASASSYRLHRLALKTVAVLTGAVFTMPQAGATLTAKIVASMKDKSLLLSDFDDTLAGYNEVLPADKVAAVTAIKKADKHFAVISDRSDTKRPNSNQLTVFESLESLPVAVRAGMYVAANSGGKVYKYDEQGVPQKVHEAPGLTDENNAAIKAAAEATKGRLSEVGATQHVADGKNPAESFNTYGYAMMLKPGSSEDSVRGAARILGEELASRGFDVEVTPRFAKDPANPPYVTFSIITKADAAAYIAKALKIDASEAAVIGDSMFVPREAKKLGWLARMGEKLSGRPQVKTGNETDRNMTRNLEGILALGVGANMDPRVSNGWALDGKGPAVTQKVLEAMASEARHFKPKDQGDKKEAWIALGAFLLVAGAAVLAWLAIAGAIGEVFQEGERLLRDHMRTPDDARFFLGGALGMIGMAGMLGHSHRLLSDPNESYAQALKRATEIAVERGAKAEDVRFIEATASTPVHDGAQWKYTFSMPNGKGGTDLIYVDFDNFLGGTQDFRARVYANAAPSKDAVPFPLSDSLFKRGVTMGPESALDALRRAQPSFGAGVSISLAMQSEPVSNDTDPWYRFYDDKGNAGRVNTRTGEVRVDRLAKPVPPLSQVIREGHDPKPAGLKHAVEPNELYALALERMRATAAKMDGPNKEIRLLSAVHEERRFNGAWVGDEWRFFFAAGGLTWMVPARRTMITETMMDAFEPESRGLVSAEEAKAGIEASLFNMAVKSAPDAALKAAEGASVARVSLLVRVDEESGDKDLWYSLQTKGDEILSMNARTGEIRRAPPAPAGPTGKELLVGLIGLAVALAIFAALWWAGAHAPAAVPDNPAGFDVPAGGWEKLFGGFLGGVGLMGALRKGKAAKPKMTDDEIRSAAASVISYKGRPWSSTEYNSVYYPALDSLKQRGATKRQIALFEKLCADAPVKGGSFNPWSGD